MKIAHISVILVLLFSIPALAQDKIMLKNGSILECRILEYKSDGVMIDFSGGKVLVKNSDIAQIIVPTPKEIKEAEYYLGKGNYSQAIARYKNALAKYNEYSYAWKEEVYFNLARCYIKEEKWALAQESLNNLRNEFKSPEANKKIQLGLAEILLARKDFSEAKNAYTEIIKKYPGEKETLAQACYYLGECLAGGKEYEQALIAFIKVEMFYYDYPEWVVKAKFCSGEMAEALKDWERVKWTYEELIEEYPDSPYSKRAKEKLVSIKIKEKIEGGK